MVTPGEIVREGDMFSFPQLHKRLRGYIVEESIVASKWFLTFKALGGSAHRYRILITGVSISYRRFLKLTKQMCPETRAAERKASGDWKSRAPRKDKGIPRLSSARLASKRRRKSTGTISARKRRLLAPVDLPVTIEHDVGGVGSRVSRVISQRVTLGGYRDLQHGARRWHCLSCPCRLREEASIIHHIYAFHRSSVPSSYTYVVPGGTGETILYTGEVRTRERRARMPWRVSAPEYE